MAALRTTTFTREDMEAPPRNARPALSSGRRDGIRGVQGYRSTRGSAAHDEQGGRDKSWVLSHCSPCPCDHQAETKFLSLLVPRRNAVIGRGQRIQLYAARQDFVWGRSGTLAQARNLDSRPALTAAHLSFADVYAFIRTSSVGHGGPARTALSSARPALSPPGCRSSLSQRQAATIAKTRRRHSRISS
jgi:hypothetical protein